MFQPRQTDHQMSEMMLAPIFGHNTSCGHAYAQRMALHVLSHRWERVCEVAQGLMRHGRFVVP